VVTVGKTADNGPTSEAGEGHGKCVGWGLNPEIRSVGNLPTGGFRSNTSTNRNPANQGNHQENPRSIAGFWKPLKARSIAPCTVVALNYPQNINPHRSRKM
jgi:hypothetical protein